MIGCWFSLHQIKLNGGSYGQFYKVELLLCFQQINIETEQILEIYIVCSVGAHKQQKIYIWYALHLYTNKYI